MHYHALQVLMDVVATLMDACSSVLMVYVLINFDAGCPSALKGGIVSYISIYCSHSWYYDCLTHSFNYLTYISDCLMYLYVTTFYISFRCFPSFNYVNMAYLCYLCSLCIIYTCLNLWYFWVHSRPLETPPLLRLSFHPIFVVFPGTW